MEKKSVIQYTHSKKHIYLHQLKNLKGNFIQNLTVPIAVFTRSNKQYQSKKLFANNAAPISRE